MDHFGGVCADDVGAEYLTILGVADDLDEAFGLARSTCATVGRERKLTHFVIDLLLLHLRFGHADGGNFRVAVSRVGDVAIIHFVHVLLSTQKLRENHALPHTLVGQHRRAGDVADSVDPLHRRLHPLVDLDEAAIGQLNAELLDADVFDDGSAAGCD